MKENCIRKAKGHLKKKSFSRPFLAPKSCQFFVPLKIKLLQIIKII